MTQFYEIRIRGRLDAQWQDWFDGMSVTEEADGTTLLSGPVPDQPALFRLLRKIRDLGLPLISVNQSADALQPQKPNSEKEKKMNANASIAKKVDPKVLLSTLWIVVMIHMLKADILSLFIPGNGEALAQTAASAGASIPLLMLFFGAIPMAFPSVMIILSRVLKVGANRWANIIIGVFTIAYIWVGKSDYPHYTFLATLETIYLLVIVAIAAKWSGREA